MNRPTLLWLLCALFASTALGLPRLAGAQQAPIFNTVKQKLAEGRQVVGATVATADAVTYAHYPPFGKRSQGGGQYGALWGSDYRAAANENVMVVAMIEQPAVLQAAEPCFGVPFGEAPVQGEDPCP